MFGTMVHVSHDGTSFELCMWYMLAFHLLGLTYNAGYDHVFVAHLGVWS